VGEAAVVDELDEEIEVVEVLHGADCPPRYDEEVNNCPLEVVPSRK
jgi:hypothetical protein